MLELVCADDGVTIYRRPSNSPVEELIATTEETRAICNDPAVAGVVYTDKLRIACGKIFKAYDFSLKESSSVVVNILRGGLNFGLRNALCDAYNWNNHTTCFLSAQRARDEANSESWHITENAYKKLYFPCETSFIIGDVVATGTSLQYALAELIREAKEAGTALQRIVFFTYGGPMASRLLAQIDAQCRELFPCYKGTSLIYLEGCFTVPDPSTPLSIRLTGTDLVKYGAEMAPEFIESQYEKPSYPLERCIIYDAGSRAFWVREYASDVISYWKQVLEMAEHGMTFEAYLKERMKILDETRFGKCSLKVLALQQIEKMRKFL